MLKLWKTCRLLSITTFLNSKNVSRSRSYILSIEKKNQRVKSVDETALEISLESRISMCNNATADLRGSFSFCIAYAAITRTNVTRNYVRDKASRPKHVITWKPFSVLRPARITGAITSAREVTLLPFDPSRSFGLAKLDYWPIWIMFITLGSAAKIIIPCNCV